MLQRGFQAKGVRDHTWLFEAGASPRLKRIGCIGADEFFYSEPSDEKNTLDERITTYESERLGALLHNLKKAPATVAPVPREAAEIVAHLVTRSGHFRNVMTEGVKALSHRAVTLFGRQEIMSRLFGFDEKEPSVRFTNLFQRIWDEQPQLAETGIPKAVLIRIAFTLGRENLEANWLQVGDALQAFGDRMATEAGPIIRDGHNKALSKDFMGGARKSEFETFVWEIVDVPPPGVILPDCCAIAVTITGETLPLMMADQNNLAGVVAPISSRRLLSGRRPGMEPFDVQAINRELAACSDEFFITASDVSEFVALSDQIGKRSRTVIDEVMVNVFKDYEPVPSGQNGEQPSHEDVSSVRTTQENSEDFRCQLTLSGFGDEETAQAIAANVQYLVSTFNSLIPLSRLDGITFAADYPAALAELDRGIPGLNPPTTVSPSEGVGIAQAPIVMRGGVIKARIIAQGWVGLNLASQNDEHVLFASHVLVHQFALVAMVHYTEVALPGTLLQPVTGALNQILYSVVSPAPDSYFAARFSASYAPSSTTETYRELARDALCRLREVIPFQRVAYRLHGDMRRLLDAVLPMVRSFLHHLATLAGHCAGLSPPLTSIGGEVEQELERSGLRAWLATFRNDLAKFADRAGKWQSFDEFYDFTKHAERILWQFKIVPWEMENGDVYVTIPLAIDAPVLLLLEAMAAKAAKTQIEPSDC
jgi:hypothetical protein